MIRLSKSVISSQEQAAVARILDKEFLGMGSETQAFEKELAAYIGGGMTVICVNTGTSALHLALQACGIGLGDEVLVPSLTYVASFQAISATGAVPIPCDVEETTGLLDIKDAAKRITSCTKAVMPVYYASATGDLDTIYSFAQAHDLRVVEDAAHAFGCTYNKQKIGSFGDVVCFSFDGIKNITSGEGGAVVSKDTEVIRKVRETRLLGVQKDTEKRYQMERSWDFDVMEQGWRYHMSDIMAAIGRIQLQRFELEFKPKRIQLAKLYRQLLIEIEGIKLFDTDLDTVVPHIQPIRILGGKRDLIRQFLLNHNIQIGIHYKPNHLLTKYGKGSVSLPVTEQLYSEILTLPLHIDISLKEVNTIVEILKQALKA